MLAVTNRWIVLPPLSPVRLMFHDGFCLVTATCAVILLAYFPATDERRGVEGSHSDTGFAQAVKVPALDEELSQPPEFTEHDLLGKGCWFLFAVM